MATAGQKLASSAPGSFGSWTETAITSLTVQRLVRILRLLSAESKETSPLRVSGDPARAMKRRSACAIRPRIRRKHQPCLPLADEWHVSRQPSEWECLIADPKERVAVH